MIIPISGLAFPPRFAGSSESKRNPAGASVSRDWLAPSRCVMT
jgi:hypothetical protein